MKKIFNEEISLQDDKHDDNIDFRWGWLDNMMKIKYYFGSFVIYILWLLNLSNLNLYIIKTC